MARLSLTEKIEQESKNRNVSLEGLLPMEFYDVREEVSPKAPVQSLIAWGLGAYGVLLMGFLVLLSTEFSAKSTSSTTTIEANPILSESAHGTMNCSPLSTFVGSEDVQCQSSFAFPNYDRFFVQSDPYGEGQDGFVTCGTFVRATTKRCVERTTELDVCAGYGLAIEANSVCRANPGGSGVYLDWSSNGQLKTIRKEINFEDEDKALSAGFNFIDEYTGPFPDSAKGVYTVSQNSLSFGLAYHLGQHNPNYVTQDGTGNVSGESASVSKCGVSQAWLSDCASFIDKLCIQVGARGAPYACTETTTSSPTFFEALGTAYANLAFASSVLLPGVAIFMVKMEERKGTKGQESGKREPVPPSSPMHTSRL